MSLAMAPPFAFTGLVHPCRFSMILQKACFPLICIDISWVWLWLCHLPHVCGNGSATCLRWPGTSVAFIDLIHTWVFSMTGLVHPWPLSHHVSGNGSAICLHGPGSSMALSNVSATICFFFYLHSYIMSVAMALPLASAGLVLPWPLK